jgi:hypothetical protein
VGDDDADDEEEEEEDEEDDDVAVDGVFDFGVECACNGFIVVALCWRFGVAIAAVVVALSFLSVALDDVLMVGGIVASAFAGGRTP